MSGFEKFLHPQNHVLVQISPSKWFILHFFGAFLKNMILNWKFQNASDFALKVLQRARFGIEKKTFSKSYWTRNVFI